MFLQVIRYIFIFFLKCEHDKTKKHFFHYLFFFHSLFFFRNTNDIKTHVRIISHAEPDETIRIHTFLFPGLTYTRTRILRYKVLSSGTDFIS